VQSPGDLAVAVSDAREYRGDRPFGLPSVNARREVMLREEQD
jgi:hypothetical protein